MFDVVNAKLYAWSSTACVLSGSVESSSLRDVLHRVLSLAVKFLKILKFFLVFKYPEKTSFLYKSLNCIKRKHV